MGNLSIVNLSVGLEHTKDDPREDPIIKKISLDLGAFLDLDARMTQMWWVTAIMAQERAASGADKRNAILAPNLLQILITTFTF